MRKNERIDGQLLSELTPRRSEFLARSIHISSTQSMCSAEPLALCTSWQSHVRRLSKALNLNLTFLGRVAFVIRAMLVEQRRFVAFLFYRFLNV